VADDAELYNLLNDEGPIHVQLNNNYYQISTSSDLNDAHTISEVSLTDENKWYNFCKKNNMGNLHATTINALLNQFEQNLEVKSSLQKYVTPPKIKESFVKSAEFFQDNMVKENMFNLYLRRMQLSQEYEDLQKEFAAVSKKAEFKSKMMVSSLASFFTLQFGLGYYCIFEVSWLGWDLVEPMTYTLGQGSFVMGLVYMFRNRKRGVEYSEMETL